MYPRDDRKVLCLDYIDVDILVVTLYCGSARYDHWGNVDKGYRGSLGSISYMWIYNYLKIKT